MDEHVPLCALHDDRNRRRRRAGCRGRSRSASSRRRSPGPQPSASRSRRSGWARTCSRTTTGVDALVVQLAGELAAVRVDGEVLVAGGGAANAVCLHRARAAGLGGLEFASAIPGTAGGGVRMNAGAYGRDFRDVLLDARRGRRAGCPDGRPRASSISRYRHSSLARGRGRRRGAAPAGAVVARSGEGARPPTCSDRRKATQPTNKRTFGSVFKNPDGSRAPGRMIEECGLKGHAIGGALISARHANFIENGGGATAPTASR